MENVSSSILRQKELEKKTKYEDLRIEIARIWNKEVSVIPVVVGALGTLTANLKKNLKELGMPNVPQTSSCVFRNPPFWAQQVF